MPRPIDPASPRQRRAGLVMPTTRQRLVGVLLGSLLVSSAHGVTIRDNRSFNTQNAALLTNAGAPLQGLADNLVAVGVGSGVYLGDGWVLSAAHFNPSTDGRTTVEFNSGFSSGADVFQNPDWTGDFTQGNDFALLQLDTAPTGLPEVALFGGDADDLDGQTFTLTGYGATGKGSSGTGQPGSETGTLHAGENVFDQVGGSVFDSDDYVDQVAFFDFDRPNSNLDNPLGTRFALTYESMIASGDSGGGAFVVEDGTAKLAGVHSLLFSPSNRPTAGYGSVGAVTTVDGILAWIADVTNDAVVLTGDANLNGTVEQGDLNAVLNNWGQTGRAWSTGDLTADGLVDQADLNAVLNHWGASNAPSLVTPTALPEPALAGLLVLAGCAGLRRRAH
ncbi:MAG: trypsin-like serine protease [Planctomycetota bacterium]